MTKHERSKLKICQGCKHHVSMHAYDPSTPGDHPKKCRVPNCPCEKFVRYAREAKINPFAGTRVELHPGLDLWARGARYGTIRNVVDNVATVAIDHPQVRKLQKIPIDRLSARLTRPIGPPGCPFGCNGYHVQIESAVAEGRALVSRYASDPTEERVWIDADALEREP